MESRRPEKQVVTESHQAGREPVQRHGLGETNGVRAEPEQQETMKKDSSGGFWLNELMKSSNSKRHHDYSSSLTSAHAIFPKVDQF